jgi:hypothetical protein
VERLDGIEAAVPALGSVDRAHASRPQPANEAEPPEDGGAEQRVVGPPP